jgi:hypothetical protein
MLRFAAVKIGHPLLFHVLILNFIHANHLLHRLCAECKQQQPKSGKTAGNRCRLQYRLNDVSSFFYGKKEM